MHNGMPTWYANTNIDIRFRGNIDNNDDNVFNEVIDNTECSNNKENNYYITNNEDKNIDNE